MITKKALLSLAARVGWTAAQVVVAAGITYVADIDAAWALLLAPVLSAAKSYIASQVGDPDTVTFHKAVDPNFPTPPTPPDEGGE